MMQSKWNRIQSGTARGTWVTLLSVLIVMLFAASASVAQGPPPAPIQISQVTWLPALLEGGILSGAIDGGSSWGINSKGVIVVSTTYGGSIEQFTSPAYATTNVGQMSNVGGLTIDSNDNLYVGDQYNSILVKIPANSDGTYTLATDPTKTAPPACTGTDTTVCSVPGVAGIGYHATGAMVFDAAGDLFIATGTQGTAPVPFSIYECTAACLYSTTVPPVSIYSEPTGTSSSQFYLGTLAFDPWGNLFFTDVDIVAPGNGENSSSYLKELPYSSSSSSFAATPTTLATFNDPTPLAHYNDSIDTLYIDPTLGTIYFALQNGGIFGMTNTETGGPNVSSLWGVTSRGAKLLKGDKYGNFFFVGYDNDNSGDTLGYISFSGATFPVTNPATTTASLIVADNTEPCSTLTTAALVVAFTSSDYSATSAGCSAMALAAGSFNSYTVTAALPAGVSVAPNATMSVSDPTSKASATTGVTNPSLSVAQNTYLTAFPSGGVYGGNAAASTTGAINSMGTVVLGSSYGNGILEFTQGGTVLTNIGTSKYGGATGMAIDNQNYLYMTTEYGNTILKAPMLPTGLYPSLPTTTAALNKLPTCQGDGSAVDSAKICQMAPGGSTSFFGVAGIIIDSNGNALITSDNELASSSTTTSLPTSVLWCSASCLYGTDQPVVLFAEPAPDAAGDQLFVGPIALDQSGNIFFTDDLLDGGGSGYNHYSDLYELSPDSTTATGYAAAPKLLFNFTPACTAAPCDYNDEIDAVAVDAQGNVFFADQYDGIYELANNSGTVSVGTPIPVAAPGTKVIVPDGNGNFYVAAYSSVVNTAGGDTFGFDSVGSIVVPGVATTAATTASFYTLNSFSCATQPVLATTFTDPEFTVPAGTPGCADVVVGDGSSSSQTVTFTPTGTGTVSATVNLADSANGGVGTGTITAQSGVVATPTFIPANNTTMTIGTNNGVVILDSTAGAAIVYTTDGTNPLTSSTAQTYSGAFTLTTAGTITVKAAATLTGATSSNVATATYTVDAALTPVATPTVSPASGATLSAPNNTVTISDTATGATILYTTDGTDPLTSSTAQTYSSPVTLSTIGKVILNAAAKLAGNAPSLVAYSTYTVATPTVATPVIAPATGTTLTIGTNNTVTITDTTTGAAIVYTTDGSDPIANPNGTAQTYTGAITLSTPGSVTITAAATLTGYTNSASATATYTVAEATVAIPTLAPATGTTLTIGTNNTVTIADTTTGATILYTTDGTDPLTSSTVQTYSTPFTLTTAGSVTVTAVAELTGETNSAEATATYTVQAAVVATVATPTFTPATGATLTIGSNNTVTIADATTGAAIVYTTDGTDPLTSSTATTYSGAITLSTAGSVTINAAATLTGDTSSAVATATYTVQAATVVGTVATPTITPATGATLVATNNSITITDTTKGATILYTLDGSAPLTSKTAQTYTAAITLNTPGNITVNAAATLTGETSSAVATATYTVTAAPTFAVAASAASVTVTSSQSATATISLTAANGFASSVSFYCSGAPAGVTCTFNPTTITLPGTTSTVVTISESKTTSQNGTNPLFPGGVTFAVALCFFGWKKRRGLMLAIVMTIGIIGLTQLTACGGSSKGTTSTMTVVAQGGNVEATTTISVTAK